jgi:hypothetical protein
VNKDKAVLVVGSSSFIENGKFRGNNSPRAKLLPLTKDNIASSPHTQYARCQDVVYQGLYELTFSSAGEDCETILLFDRTRGPEEVVQLDMMGDSDVDHEKVIIIVAHF